MARPWENPNNTYHENYWGPDKVPFEVPMEELRTIIRDNELPAPENLDSLDTDEKFYDAMVPIMKAKGIEPPVRKELSRDAFYDAMVANGWTKDGDDNIIAAMYWLGCHNQKVNNPEKDYFEHLMNTPAPTDKERSELLAYVDNIEINQLRENSRGRDILGWKKTAISNARAKTGFRMMLAENGFDLLEDERVLDVLYDCSVKQGIDTSATRIRYNTKIEGQHDTLASFLSENIRRAEEEGWFADEDEKYKLDILKSERDKQNKIVEEIRERKNREDYIKDTAVIRKYLEHAIKNNLDEVTNSAVMIPEEWGMDGDEETQIRRNNIISARNDLLSPILSLLHDPRNKEFIEKVRNGADTADLEIHFGRLEGTGILSAIKDHDAARQEECLNIISKIQSLSIEDTADLISDEMLEDSFWNHYSRTLTNQEIKEMQEKFLSISDKGLDWEEFTDTSAYNSIMRSNGFRTSEYVGTPYNLVKRSFEGEEGMKYIRTQMSVPEFERVMSALQAVEEAYDKNKDNIMDMDTLELSGWFNRNGYDMIQNTILMTNGFEEKIVDGKSVKFINLSDTIDDLKLDRDLLDMDSYNRLVANAREAQKIYNDNKDTFRRMFDTMDTVHHSNLGGEILGEMVQEVSMDKNALKEMNRFRHLLYGMKVADADVCKLVDLKNNKKAVLVQPLAENTEFTKDMVKTEKDYLDTCIEMLNEPTTRVNRSSREYWNVIDSLKNMKNSMDKEYASNEEAKRAYIKSVNKVLNDINIYREHKAKDGVKNDATHDKLIALERVDKLLRTRYKILEQREYEDNISGISELFKVDVEEGKMGDEYLLDKALQKINNMNKSLDQLKAEFEIIDEETAGITRANTLATTSALKQTAADILTSMEPVKKSETQQALDKLEENAHLKAAEDKEQKFRDKLDPNDDYGKEKLIASAEKELYMASVKEQAKLKTVKEGPEAGEKLMNSKMSEIEKGNNLRYRTFKFEKLTDNDFNKEFQKKVIEGAANGKTGSRDIMKFADEALSSCYKKSGKNTQYLDELSATLGSKVNSKTFKNKVSLDKLKQDEDAKAPKKESKKEDMPIKRSRTFDETKAFGKGEAGPKKK